MNDSRVQLPVFDLARLVLRLVGLNWLRKFAGGCCLLLAVTSIQAVESLAQDGLNPQSIVLRDLTLIRNNPVIKFDQRSLELADGQRLNWDQVLQANVGPQRQSEFDALVTDIGLPLFRMKHRIAIGDAIGAGEVAEKLYHKLTFNGLTTNESYFDPVSVHQILIETMKSRVIQGNFEQAVLPFLQTAMFQRTLKPEQLDRLSSRLPDSDVTHLLATELMPIWFDRDKALLAFQELATSLNSTDGTKNTGAIVYLISFAVAAEQPEQARHYVKQIPDNTDPTMLPWLKLLQAQIDWQPGNSEPTRSVLDQTAGEFPGDSQYLYRYLHATARWPASRALSTAASSIPADSAIPAAVEPKQNAAETNLEQERVNAALLELLSIPAECGDRHRRLAAAALFAAAKLAEKFGHQDEARILERELQQRYPESLHAQAMRR